MDIVFDVYRWIIALSLALPRILVVFIILPFLDRQFIPIMIKNAIAVAVSLAVVPLVYHQIDDLGFSLQVYIVLMLKEALIGTLIGYSMATVFWAIASMGFFIDTQRGALSAQLFTPIIGGTTSPLGALLVHIAAVLFFIGGGFLMLLQVLYLSYLTWPVDGFIPAFDMRGALFIVDAFSSIMTLMFLLAAPVVIIMIVVEFGVGMIGRFVPSINVFLLAMPVKSLLVFLFLWLSMGYLIRFLDARMLDVVGRVRLLERVL
ncbi:MAG: type III secretion system export apparatus subunit SctT [Thiotrichales bacterium]